MAYPLSDPDPAVDGGSRHPHFQESGAEHQKFEENRANRINPLILSDYAGEAAYVR
jgi:hypothetical protein